MVAGGPYGLEEIIGRNGYSTALWILILTPLLWSLPTALMVSELASALPREGGFYVWVRRGLGPFWGFQESWLTFAGSVFEMALYPTLVVEYLSRIAPSLVEGHRGFVLELAMIAGCAAWNIAGARAVGEGSIALNVLLFAPFVVLVALAFARPVALAPAAPVDRLDLLGGIVIAMWNYMGWDNLSTIAGEVERPQRTYPLVMLAAVILVVVSYLVPVAAMAYAQLDMGTWMTGGWVDAGQALGGSALATALAAAGIVGAVGTFAALMLSFTRLPAVMAADGFLPRIFARLHTKTGAPWVAIVACAVAWAACLPLGFVELLLLDVLLTGLSILLEFWALVALRIREPNLARPFRVPGGLFGTIAIGIPPLALVAVSVIRNASENVGATTELEIGLGLIALGVALYFINPGSRQRQVKAHN
jgi:amino acid transporter